MAEITIGQNRRKPKSTELLVHSQYEGANDDQVIHTLTPEYIHITGIQHHIIFSCCAKFTETGDKRESERVTLNR